jgi:hypothetical protein
MLNIRPGSAEEHAIYAALKHIFTGDNVNIRQPQKIRTLVNQHEAEGRLAPLITSPGIAAIGQIAKRLLADGIFNSEAAARGRFMTSGIDQSSDSTTMPITLSNLPKCSTSTLPGAGTSAVGQLLQSTQGEPSNQSSATVERLPDVLKEGFDQTSSFSCRSCLSM